MVQAQQQANQQIMTAMVESMTVSCFDKCAGTSGDRLDSKEQGWCVAVVLFYNDLCCAECLCLFLVHAVVVMLLLTCLRDYCLLLREESLYPSL
ncbi:hypothetical protein ACHAXR_006704 [Thalassiosira sp. AJA248-18]